MAKQNLQALYAANLTKVKACELALRRTRVISDYSSSLEEVLKNTNALVEKLNKEWEEL